MKIKVDKDTYRNLFVVSLTDDELKFIKWYFKRHYSNEEKVGLFLTLMIHEEMNGCIDWGTYNN